MARSKRRTFRRRSSTPRKRADWVYRGDIHDEAGNPIDTFGTYVPQAGFTQAVGSANATIHWLYDSVNFRKFTATIAGNAPRAMPSSWRAEGGKPLLLRVQGWMSVLPVTWAAGSVVFLGMRFGTFEQSPNTGNAIFPTGYNMWDATGNDSQTANVWANEGRHVREFRRSWSFDIGQTAARMNFTFNFGFRRRLMPNEGFGIYTELATGTTSAAIVHAFRTLVVDEG